MKVFIRRFLHQEAIGEVLLFPIGVAIFLVFVSLYNFLLFHTLAELFPVIISVLMLVIAWETRDFSRNYFLMFLACSFFWVGALDLVHLLVYKGMNIFPFTDANPATQLWIIARYMQALILLVAPFYLSRPVNLFLTFFGFGLISFVFASLIVTGHFPDAFVEGSGLTAFKIGSEYVIILLLAGALVHLIKKRKQLGTEVFDWMVLAIVLTMISELSFTFYVSVYGLSNLVGHIFKFFAFWLIFIAIVRVSLREPYVNLESIVSEKTKHLSEEIVEHKRTGSALLHAKKVAEKANRAKSVFLTSVSHELRTPLNTIIGFSEMLKSDESFPNDQKEKLSFINRSGEHLYRTIDNILELAEIEAEGVYVVPEPFDIVLMISDVSRKFHSDAEAKELKFSHEVDQTLTRYVKADSGKLQAILNNLLANAIKFTTEGEVSVRARTSVNESGSTSITLVLEVQDSGCGIPAEQFERVFLPFEQAEDVESTVKGAGLGLTITKAYVDLMGGEISIESEVGKGTVFRVVLPLELVDAKEVIGNSSTKPEVFGLAPDQPEWRVLVVDDDLENQILLQTLLAEAGVVTRKATNGKEAIALYEEWKPHLIWVNMNMSQMDGFEMADRIRALPKSDDVKIIGISTNNVKHDKERALHSGCNDLIRPPYKAYDIFRAMEVHLGMRLEHESIANQGSAEIAPELTADMLIDLPAELRAKLNESAIHLDRNAAEAVISRIHALNPVVADGLFELTKRYQFSRILELLEDV